MSTQTKVTALERVMEALDVNGWEVEDVSEEARDLFNATHNPPSYPGGDVTMRRYDEYTDEQRQGFYRMFRHLSKNAAGKVHYALKVTGVVKRLGYGTPPSGTLFFSKTGAYIAPTSNRDHGAYDWATLTAALNTIVKHGKPALEAEQAREAAREAERQREQAEKERQRQEALTEAIMAEDHLMRTLADMLDSIEAAETRGDDRPYALEQIIAVSGHILGARSEIARLSR